MDSRELMLQMQNQITIQQGNITFLDFEPLKQQAIELAAHIQGVQVNEETIKASKKLLAAVNKSIKDLEDRRITIKKVMMQPYEIFENQVKEIVGIVKAADEIVRQQVRDLEESERMDKQNHLEELFGRRITMYDFKNLFGFLDFLKPQHLNKTTSIDAVEKEMVEFFERIQADFMAIQAMQNADEVLAHYIEVKNLAAAIAKASQDAQRKQQAAQAIKKGEPGTSKFRIIIFDEKDAKLATMLLNENKIKFELEKDEN